MEGEEGWVIAVEKVGASVTLSVGALASTTIKARGAQVVTSVAQYVASPEQKKVKPFQINILATRADVESTSSKGLPHLIFEGRRKHLKVKQHLHDSGDKGDTCNTSARLVQHHVAQHMHDCRDGCDEMPG